MPRADNARGVNGLIPARADELEQLTATLVEWHDLVRKTNFNVFASQGNQREIMQKTTMGVINRKIDQDVIDMIGPEFAHAPQVTIHHADAYEITWPRGMRLKPSGP